jgi:hypothetical protein
LAVALLAAQLLMPVFNELTGKHLRIPYAEPGFGLALLGMLLGTGLLAVLTRPCSCRRSGPSGC